MRVVTQPDVISKSVAAFGLPGTDSEVAMTVDEEDWSNALSFLWNDHATGLAIAAAEAGRIQLTDEQAAELLEAHRAAMLVPLSVERALVWYEICTSEAVAVSLAVLIPSERAAERKAVLERLAGRFNDVVGVVNGPWPPYSFASVESTVDSAAQARS